MYFHQVKIVMMVLHSSLGKYRIKFNRQLKERKFMLKNNCK